MRRTTLAVTKVRVHGRIRYCVTTPRADGPGRERKFFKTKSEAETHLGKKKQENITHGVRAFALSDRDRTDYLWCVEVLKPHGLTVRKAIETLLPQLAAQERTLLVSAAVTRLIETKQKAGLSKRHTYTLKNRLSRFANQHPERTLASFTHRDIEQWLHALPVGPQSANHFRTALHTLFTYGMKYGACITNPCIGLEKRKVVRPAPAVLTPTQLANLLEASADDKPIRAYIALGAFAGLRSAETVRLDWRDVNLTTGFVTVNASHAKTSRRRLIPIGKALHEWLQPLAEQSGPIVPYSNFHFNAHWREVRKAAGLFEHWEGNELRHSYATYRLAQTANADRTALELGNSPSILREHYAELCTPQLAETYFATRPEKPANITDINAAA